MASLAATTATADAARPLRLLEMSEEEVTRMIKRWAMNDYLREQRRGNPVGAPAYADRTAGLSAQHRVLYDQVQAMLDSGETEARRQAAAGNAGAKGRVRRFMGERARMLRKVGNLPSLRMLGNVGMAALAGKVGWEIGSALRPVFYEVSTEPTSTPTMNERLVPCLTVQEKAVPGVSPGPCNIMQGDPNVWTDVDDDMKRVRMFSEAQQPAFPPLSPRPDFMLQWDAGGQTQFVWRQHIEGGDNPDTYCRDHETTGWDEPARPRGTRWMQYENSGVAGVGTYNYYCGWDQHYIRQRFSYISTRWAFPVSETQVDSEQKDGLGGMPDRVTRDWPGRPKAEPMVDDPTERKIDAELFDQDGKCRRGEYPQLCDFFRAAADQGDPAGGLGATMPDCTGKTAASCATAIESAAAGLAVVVIDEGVAPWADVKPKVAPDRVVKTLPVAGASIATGTVQVWENPPAGGMPVVIPKPDPRELGTAYVQRATGVGLVPELRTLTSVDPAVGPDEVSRVSPRPTPLDSTDARDYAKPGDGVDVYVNPATAPHPNPDPGGGPDPGGDPNTQPDPVGHPGPDNIPDVDFEPLRAAGGLACESFPFGIPCWFYEGVSKWAKTSPGPPVITVPMPVGGPMSIDFGASPVIEQMVQLWRLFFLAVTTLYMGLRFYGWAFNRAPGGGGKDD